MSRVTSHCTQTKTQQSTTLQTLTTDSLCSLRARSSLVQFTWVSTFGIVMPFNWGSQADLGGGLGDLSFSYLILINFGSFLIYRFLDRCRHSWWKPRKFWIIACLEKHLS